MTATSGRPPNPLNPFLEGQGVVVLDGGLATTLESYGHDLNDRLWSARLLLDAPEAVTRAHRDFLDAGADCIATVTYQATHRGLMEEGLDPSQADELLRLAVTLARDARDAFWAEPANREGRLRPLVAGSVGPYGAYLADGSEYTGDYDLTEEALKDFHRGRCRVLADAGVELLAFETIPSGAEARALLSLMAEMEDSWAWMSFQCRDGGHLADGTPLAEVADLCAASTGLAAVGINCVAPSLVPELIGILRAAEAPAVAVYPNSGERYDASIKGWSPGEAHEALHRVAPGWREAGAGLVGGCCRVLPEEIRLIRAALLPGDRRAP